MQKNNKSKISLIKVIFICLILILLSGAGVMAVTTKVGTVTITLSNGYEMSVFTSETNVGKILDDNNIIIENNEKVSPSLDEDITHNKTIVITDKSAQEIEVAKVSESGVEMTLDSLLDAYDTIKEKIEVIEQSIPFETVTKDVSGGSSNTKNKVLQEGVEGKKKVTYKIKYQNDVEIDRTQISEEIIQEPVEKIIQVSSKKTSSRSSSTKRHLNNDTTSNNSSDSSGSPNVKVYRVTAYCSCSRCCGHANGYTASGRKATANHTVAAPSNLPYGTNLVINGRNYVVEDRGGSVKGNTLDIYVNSHSEALAWGVKYLPVEIK